MVYTLAVLHHKIAPPFHQLVAQKVALLPLGHVATLPSKSVTFQGILPQRCYFPIFTKQLIPDKKVYSHSAIGRPGSCQRRRDENKNKVFAFEGGRGGLGGREENRPKTLVFVGKRHDNKIMKVHILLSREIVLSLRRLLIGCAREALGKSP